MYLYNRYQQYYLKGVSLKLLLSINYGKFRKMFILKQQKFKSNKILVYLPALLVFIIQILNI